jgi:hypothetical protein
MLPAVLFPYAAAVADSQTVWCPSCGEEYRAGTPYCADCRVALVADRPNDLVPVGGGATSTEDLVELGEWPRLQAQILRNRLETAGISVLADWSGPGSEAVGVLVVPAGQEEFALAVVNEIDVDDEVPDTSPHAYVVRIEEHLSATAELLQELRTKLDELEAGGEG